jgi:VanZ family protein
MKKFLKNHRKSIFVIAITFIISFINPPEIEEIPNFKIGWDKIFHALVYFAMSATLLLEFFTLHSYSKISFKFWLYGALLPAFTGALIEVLQGWLFPLRSCDLSDWLADLTGIAVALIFSKYIQNLVKKHTWLTRI